MNQGVYRTMKAQLEQRLVELRAEYDSGQKILKDIEIKLVELENRKKNLNETLLRISGAVELLEEVLEEESKSSIPEVPGPEVLSQKYLVQKYRTLNLRKKKLKCPLL